MNFRQIEAFRAVMTAGSVTLAGQMLSVSQPAVSRLIRDLEHAVGFQLFERRNNRLVPSTEGRQLYAEVERSFVRLEHIAETARAIRTMSSGTLRIASTSLIAHGILPSIVGEFLRKHTNIFVEMTHGSRRYVIDCVASQVYDVAIEIPPIKEKAVREEALTKQTALCVMHENHALANKPTITVKDLQDESFIAPEAGSIFRLKIDQVFESNKVWPAIRVQTATQKSICNMVACEAGVGIVAPYVIEDALGMPLVFRKFTPSIVLEYALLLPATRPPSRLTTAFISILRERLGQGFSVKDDATLTRQPATP